MGPPVGAVKREILLRPEEVRKREDEARREKFSISAVR
jgi:hypothetical protein